MYYYIPRCVWGYTGFQFWNRYVCRWKHFEHLLKIAINSETISDTELNRMNLMNLSLHGY